jgi:hypothetical protein
MPTTPQNYLKYWKVIRQYYKAKHKLTQSDLDVLLFLHTEKYFTRERFDRYNRILSWDRLRFESLLKRGWIEVFRPKEGRKRTVYNMSEKGMYLINDIYRKLAGQEIPMNRTNNPMVLRRAKYSHKVYLDMIKDMNEFIQQQRHQPRE